MNIERIELHELSVRLRFRFETSFGVEQDMRKVLLVIARRGPGRLFRAGGLLLPGVTPRRPPAAGGWP